MAQSFPNIRRDRENAVAARHQARRFGNFDRDGSKPGLASCRRPSLLYPNGRNRYRDSPLRGGASLIASRWESIDRGEAEPSITVAAARSSSTVQHELRCFSRLRRSPAFTWREVMRIVVLRESSVPGRASRRRRFVHVSHSWFAGLQRRDPAYNLLVKCTCCHFAQAIGVPSDPGPGCARCLLADRQWHHSLEGPINLLARRSIPHHQRQRPHQTLVQPAAP